ncbi:MAG: hypothetical protein M3O09_07200 [Acidobacteriota bacterium]|nr:hypothetical protein [Acidobacteriota bacterium]
MSVRAAGPKSLRFRSPVKRTEAIGSDHLRPHASVLSGNRRDCHTLVHIDYTAALDWSSSLRQTPKTNNPVMGHQLVYVFFFAAVEPAISESDKLFFDLGRCSSLLVTGYGLPG